MTRFQIALRAYSNAWDRCRAMANAPAVLMGPPRMVGTFRVFAAYPAFTKEQIAREARRCNRMFRAMNRYRAAA